jgi:hypothetical protein
MTAVPVKLDNVKLADAKPSVVHKLPCKIEHTGEARVSDLFVVAPDGTSSFRGRELQRVVSAIPEGYRGIVLNKSKTTTDAEEPEFQVTHSFDQITSWGWDSKPATMNFSQLISIQTALHGSE